MLRDRYAALARAGQIGSDRAQLALVDRLDALLAVLRDYRLPQKPGPLSFLFGGGRNGDAAPQGLYIHGAVGRGKTMLMDLFFDAAEVERKRRAHFHAFMGDVHRRIHEWRQLAKAGRAPGDEPIGAVAHDLSQEAALLCFDEFAVTDIGDAMVLGRLFEALFAAGVVVVATSNTAPRDLYRDGLNRALFLPFIAMIEARMEVVRLDARTDFRLEKIGGAPVWLTPADARARGELDRMFLALTGLREGAPEDLPLLGRAVHVPQAAGGVARFAYADLCGKPLGAPDFLAIARAFHTVFIDAIAVIGEGRRNEAKRFITLIDTFYDSHVKLIASAEAAPDALYRGGAGTEAFEFARVASRLVEMRSQAYLGAPHGGHATPGASTGLVET